MDLNKARVWTQHGVRGSDQLKSLMNFLSDLSLLLDGGVLRADLSLISL